jgi:hypothetical protein
MITPVRHELNRHESQDQHQTTPDSESTAWNLHKQLRECRLCESTADRVPLAAARFSQCLDPPVPGSVKD